MSPVQALRSALRHATDFEGRASRSEYWWWQGWLLLGAALWWTVSLWLPAVAGILAAVLLLAIIVPSLAVLVRRLHDTGRSGWWIAVVLIPLLGELTLLLFTLDDSQDHPNAWGPPPPGSSYAAPAAWAPVAEIAPRSDRAALPDREPEPDRHRAPRTARSWTAPSARKWAGAAAATLFGAILLLSDFLWVPLAAVAPFVGPFRVERPEAGFAIAFPLDWERADTALADPEDWWDSEKVGDVDAYHAEVLAMGSLLLARKRSPFEHENCVLYDSTTLAAEPPVWTTLADAMSEVRAREADPDAIDVEHAFLDLPGGPALRIDTLWDDGWDESGFFLEDGERWFWLMCVARHAPDDRWRSIAETFEFLPGGESDDAQLSGEPLPTLGARPTEPTSPRPRPAASPDALDASTELERAHALASRRSWHEAEVAYGRAIELDPTDASAYGGRCHVLRELHELERALADCHRAIELDPGEPAWYVSRGNVYDDRGDTDLALAEYDRAIALAPSSAVAYRNRGVARDQAGDLQGALADYDQAIALDPSYAAAWASRGGVEYRLKRYDAASKDLEEALELDPDDVVALVNRGILRTWQGDLDDALADCDRAIALAPGYAFAYAARAETRIEMGDHRAAIDDADRAIDLDPTGAPGYFSRGLAYAWLGKDRRAIADYDRAITLDPDHFEAISGRARAYLRRDDAEAALADIERLIAAEPDTGFFYAFRGLAEAMAGDIVGARADVSKARTMTSDPEEIAAIDEIVSAIDEMAGEPDPRGHRPRSPLAGSRAVGPAMPTERTSSWGCHRRARTCRAVRHLTFGVEGARCRCPFGRCGDVTTGARRLTHPAGFARSRRSARGRYRAGDHRPLHADRLAGRATLVAHGVGPP